MGYQMSVLSGSCEMTWVTCGFDLDQYFCW